MKLSNLINPLLIIFFAVILRLIPHPANVVPITAMALFGGVYLNKKYAIIVPLIAMFVSDLFLGFHQSMPLVYASFILIGLIGLWLAKHKTFLTVTAGTLFSSILFFLLTNFNYWYATALYPKTLAGLLQSYTNALPFLRNALLGDMFFVALFFGSYELALHFMSNRKSQMSKLHL